MKTWSKIRKTRDIIVLNKPLKKERKKKDVVCDEEVDKEMIEETMKKKKKKKKELFEINLHKSGKQKEFTI